MIASTKRASITSRLIAVFEMSTSEVTAKKRKNMSDETFRTEENQYGPPEIGNGIMRYHRKLPPTHHLFQIKSYSALATSKLERVASPFEACGYWWKMIMFLRGHSEANKDKYISLYLAIDPKDDEELPLGWEVWVDFKFFVHDQINDKYLVVQDAQDQLKQFYTAKGNWGFGEFLSIDVFKDVNNGYLFNDCCTFGAEVFVGKYSGEKESISAVLKPPSYTTYTWKLENFSQIKTDFCYSESFTAGGRRRKLKVYPKGHKSGRNGFVCIALVLDESGSLCKKLFAEFTLRVKNQLCTLRNRAAKGEKCLRSGTNFWCSSKFMAVDELKDATQGYCVNDTVIIECQFSLIIEVVLFQDSKLSLYHRSLNSYFCVCVGASLEMNILGY